MRPPNCASPAGWAARRWTSSIAFPSGRTFQTFAFEQALHGFNLFGTFGGRLVR
jgi:hypothetical protein